MNNPCPREAPSKWLPPWLRRRPGAFRYVIWALLVSFISWGQWRGLAADGQFRALLVPDGGKAGFELLNASAHGIGFTNFLSDLKTAENQIRLNGSGVACGDVDGDGRCDVFFAGLENGCRLYRNLGQWKFQDITKDAGVACADQYSSGATFADVDGDSDLDLLVNGIGTGSRLFLNDGRGRFQESTTSGLVRKYAATTSALGDIDGNGTLDMYVANYRTTTIRTTGLPMLRAASGKMMLRPQDREDYELSPTGMVIEHGEPHMLYLNNGRGVFTPVAWTNGVFLDEQGKALSKHPKEWGLCAAFRDLNGDRLPDLYVCNDFGSPDRVCTNLGGGRFKALSGLALRSTCTFSMAADFADINRDGHDDLFVADMLDPDHVNRVVQFSAMEQTGSGLRGMFERPQVNRNVLHLNRGDGTYAEIAYYAGVEATGWTWSPIFLDVDLDGYEDLLFSTGHAFDTQDLDAIRRIEAMGPMGTNKIFKILMYPRLKLPRVAYRNLGNLRFANASDAWRFNDPGVAQGMALADLDNDGDLDVVMNSLNEPARVYKNTGVAPRVAVRLKGLPPNSQGVGARIIVRGGAVPAQSQEIMCGGRYLSGDEALRVFAAGTLTNRLSIEVRWRSGKNSHVSNALPNHVYEIAESEANAGQVKGAESRRAGATLFEDASQRLNHTHEDSPYDDFARQALLPNKLSQLGPGVAWGDLNGDGWDDLVVSAGAGATASGWTNDGRGGFGLVAMEARVGDDSTTPLVFGRRGATGLVWLGAASYENPGARGLRVVAGSVGGDFQEITNSPPGSSTGPLAAAEIDADGELELFVGGRTRPGRYPEPANSALWRSAGGRLVEDEINTRALIGLGLATGAVFTDLNNDGFPELVVACEWGPLKVLQNERGKLREATREWGLAEFTGWWNGVAAGDFNADGLMDLVGCNWGENTKYRPSPEHPARIYYGDFTQGGGVDVVEAYYDARMGKEVPQRDFDTMAAAMPYLRGVFGTYRAFGNAGVAEVLGARQADARSVSAVTLRSTVFLNRGGKFDALPLPAEAQFSPAFGCAVADFDGDGREDLALAQNFFATQPQTTRSDAGRGLLLLGNGDGTFRAVPGQTSGIMGYGEQRGAATADFDQDGRADLVIGQNGAPTLLFRNMGAKPGLRVRLFGGEGNSTGIGASVRFESGGKSGPAREVNAGSGYWSQNSPVQVLANAGGNGRLHVRWPGGAQTAAAVPEGAREVEISMDGTSRVVR